MASNNINSLLSPLPLQENNEIYSKIKYKAAISGLALGFLGGVVIDILYDININWHSIGSLAKVAIIFGNIMAPPFIGLIGGFIGSKIGECLDNYYAIIDCENNLNSLQYPFNSPF